MYSESLVILKIQRKEVGGITADLFIALEKIVNNRSLWMSLRFSEIGNNGTMNHSTRGA
jgi:hypothetical protein